MSQSMLTIIKLCVMSALLFASVLTSADSNSDDIHSSSLKRSVYSNKYLGLKVSLPKKWVIQDQSKLKDLIEDGGDFHAGEDEQLRERLNLSEIRSVYLFAAFQHPFGRSIKFNPSIIAIAEPISDVSEIKNGRDYLERSRDSLEAGQLDVKVLGDIETTTINNTAFDLMRLNLKYSDTRVHLEHYVFIKNGYALVFIISYLDDAQKAKLDAILNTIRFE